MDFEVDLSGCDQSKRVRGVSVTTCTPVWAAPEEVSSRLYAAKAAVYRGRGLAVQMPWQLPFTGLFLVVDLFSGIGGAPLALSALGLAFVCILVEKDYLAARCAAANYPNAVHVQLVESIDGKQFDEVLQRRCFVGGIVGGGSPCQGNTSLNKHRLGLQDERTRLAEHVPRIAKAIQARRAGRGIPIFFSGLRIYTLLRRKSLSITVSLCRHYQFWWMRVSGAWYPANASSGSGGQQVVQSSFQS